MCAAHSEALRLSFLSFATPLESGSSQPDQARQGLGQGAIKHANTTKPGVLGCVLSAEGFYSILEQSGVCDRKDVILSVKLVEDIVGYILDGVHCA